MPRIKMNIAYVGTNYCGWQIQDNAPSIQAELEKVLQNVLGCLVRVHGAGRTDSGVHADAQIAHADIPTDKLNLDWQRIFNTTLPKDICINSIDLVADDFHSRFDCISKTYHYTFWTNRHFIPPRIRPYAWDCGQLDIVQMQEALQYLIGKHDFASFQNAGTPIEDTVRQINFASLEPICSWLPENYGQYVLTLQINANGFLKQMVRNIAGLLVAVGRNKFKPQDVPELLKKTSRICAPPTAPACGLSLHAVQYPQ